MIVGSTEVFILTYRKRRKERATIFSFFQSVLNLNAASLQELAKTPKKALHTSCISLSLPRFLAYLI